MDRWARPSGTEIDRNGLPWHTTEPGDRVGVMGEQMNFGTWLKQRRKMRGLTQEELAHKVGCSWETIRKIEEGARKPSKQMADLLSLHLGVPADQYDLVLHMARGEPGRDADQTGERRGRLLGEPASPNQHRYSHSSFGNLPSVRTSFVGRERETHDILSLLRQESIHLLTLTGPPGIGKSRLAMHAAARYMELDKSQKGAADVCFVSLAAISDPALVAATIARELGAPESAGHTVEEALMLFLQGRRIILLIDNFEQVLAATALLSDLLSRCPDLKLFVTSRAALRVYGEQEYSVPPMCSRLETCGSKWHGEHEAAEAAEADVQVHAEAVELFVQRARAINPGFVLTPENEEAIVEICQRLDGLPLAIELAAARISILSPQKLLARLTTGLPGSHPSRLKLLTGGPRDLPVRQQTMREAIEWSYNLLDEEEKRLFRRLAVFMGGRTLDAIEAVCNIDGDLKIDPLDGVASLIDKSLLRQQEAAGGEYRFWMLETIHEYAREKLREMGEEQALRQRHASFFASLVEQVELDLAGAHDARWLQRWDEELDNIRAVLGWALTGESVEQERVELALRLVSALRWFWELRGHPTEGRRWLREALARSNEVSPAVRAKGLYVAGALALAQYDPEQAGPQLRESIELYRALGDRSGTGYTLNALGRIALYRGDPGEAQALLEESAAMFREVGDRRGLCLPLVNAGEVARLQGDYATTRHLLEQALPMLGELGERGGIAIALHNLGRALASLGEYDRAVTRFIGAIRLGRELGFNRIIALCLTGLAGVAAHRKQPERAARLFGAASAIMEPIGGSMVPPDSDDFWKDLSAARCQVDEATWQTAWTEGRAMSVDQAIAYALQEK